MTLDELLLTRQSTRSYDPTKKVSIEDLEKIVEAGRIAPSARNGQPWKFIVVTSEDLLPKIRKECQAFGFNKFTNDVNAFILILEDKDLLKALPRDFTQIDTGLAISQMILKACDLGLSTCILGGIDGEGLKKVCGIKSKQPIRIVLTVGYAKDDDPIRPKNRKDIKEISVFM